jgi:hypothetical protein
MRVNEGRGGEERGEEGESEREGGVAAGGAGGWGLLLEGARRGRLH